MPLLRNMGEIIIPHSVYLEILSMTSLADDWQDWIKVIRLTSSQRKEAVVWAKSGNLHVGESEAFVIAKNKKANCNPAGKI